MSAPPSYSESISKNPHKFCYKCGNKLEDVPTACKSCGQASFINVQPFPPLPSYSAAPNTGEPPILPPAVVTQPVANPTNPPPPTSNGGLELYIVKDNRLIIDFEKVACCPHHTVGIDKRIMENIPTPLLEKGITHAQWKMWMRDLMKVQKKAPSIVGCLCIFCFPGLMFQSMLCAIFCPTSMSHPLDCLPCFYGDWYTGLKSWMATVNQTLNPLDMHAKLLTYKPHNSAPRSVLYADRSTGKDHNYEMSFLAIALSRNASQKLMSESWDHGVGDGCTSGIGRVL